MKMRKFIGIMLSAAMALSAVPTAFAEPGDTEAMRAALEKVKSKIDVPAELGEFESDAYDYGNGMRYSFRWSNDDGDYAISADCDEGGHIFDYHENHMVDRVYEQKLPKITKEQAVAAADAFLAQAAPETMSSANDRMELESARGGYYDSYAITYKRVKNGFPVNGNTASITIGLFNDRIYVSDAYINYSYTAQFEGVGPTIDAPEEKFAQTYPAELIYKSTFDYAPYGKDSDEHATQLVYRIKDGNAGCISAYTGEIVEPDAEQYNKEEVTMDTAAQESGLYNAAPSALTEQEIKELEAIEGLYTAAEAEAFLKGLPQLKLSDDYTVSDSAIYTDTTGTGDDKDKSYRLEIRLTTSVENEDYWTYAYFDAERERLTRYSSYIYKAYEPERDAIGDDKISAAKLSTDEFLKAVLPDKISEFEEITDEDTAPSYEVYRNYRRVVNGLPFINDTISVTYDAEDERITYYNLDYDDNASFADPAGVIAPADAYESMKKTAPIKQMYIYSGGMYRLVYYMDGSPVVDAFTGEDIYKDKNVDYSGLKYDDISGHWCEEAVNALLEYGIGLPGESLKPDSQITQAEALRLFVAGGEGRYYLNSEIDDIYNYCYRTGVLKRDERNDDAFVTREQAFVYLIRIAGYERIAALPDIYKVNYSDGSELSEGLEGYAAILSGMGIIAGSGGRIRPKDNLTRAEAMTILYRYMK